MPESVERTIRVKGNIFARPDYFLTDVTKGATRTPAGTRICTLSSDFLLGFRDALVYECGKSYRQVLKSCGFRWGARFMTRFEKELTAAYQAPVKTLAPGVIRTCLADAFAVYGWGRLTIEAPESADGLTQVTLQDSVMPGLVAESERPVDQLMTGLLAAVFSHLAGRQLDCVQTECPSVGAAASRFVVAEPARVAEIEQWLDTAPTDEPPTHQAVVERLDRPTTSEPSMNGTAVAVA